MRAAVSFNYDSSFAPDDPDAWYYFAWGDTTLYKYSVSTGNRVAMKSKMAEVRMLGLDDCTPLFQAAAEATEEAIWNALVAAETMTGYQGHTAHAIPHDRLQEAVKRYARKP